jgi:hypothetical protein
LPATDQIGLIHALWDAVPLELISKDFRDATNGIGFT